MTELFEHLPGQQQDQRPRQRKASRQRNRRTRRVRSLVLVAGCLALVLIAGLVGVKVFKPMYDEWRAPKDYEGAGTGEVMFQVEQGQNGSQIAANLAKLGVVKTSEAFLAEARANPSSSSIQPGTYKLKKQMSSASALSALLNKDARVSVRVQLPEGLRASEALARISKATGFSVAELQAAAKTPAAGLPADAKGSLEGYLYPATYALDPGLKPAGVINEIVGSYKKAMSTAGVPAAQQRRVLTLASIVESEAGNDADRPKVARVFQNRLDQGMPLQSDATVHYAFNSRSTVTTTAQQRASNSPYNTYKHAGLPPGPINAPGLAAIKAAYQPTPGSWLYFVAVNPETGQTKFATTLAEHNRNVAEFQKWLRENSDN